MTVPTQEELYNDPMARFSRWIDRNDGDDDEEPLSLVRRWQNDEEGEALTLTLDFDCQEGNFS